MSTTDPDIREYVQQNRDEIAHVLRHSQDPYARACALVLLSEGGTERDVEKVIEEVEKCA